MKNLKTLCIENWYHFWNLLTEASDGKIINSNEIYASLTNLPHGIMKPVLRSNLTIDNYRHLKNIVSEKLDTEEKSFSWWVDNPAAIEMLTDMNLTTLGNVPMMCLDLNEQLQQNTTAIKVKQIDSNNFAEWEKIIGIAFHFDAHTMSAYRQAFEKLAQHYLHFAAYKDEKIIGVGSLLTGTEVAGCYNLAVLPEYRRHGVATAIHHARIHAARKLNFKHMTLQATPMATKLDASLGFKTVANYSVFIDQA